MFHQGVRGALLRCATQTSCGLFLNLLCPYLLLALPEYVFLVKMYEKY